MCGCVLFSHNYHQDSDNCSSHQKCVESSTTASTSNKKKGTKIPRPRIRDLPIQQQRRIRELNRRAASRHRRLVQNRTYQQKHGLSQQERHYRQLQEEACTLAKELSRLHACLFALFNSGRLAAGLAAARLIQLQQQAEFQPMVSSQIHDTEYRRIMHALKPTTNVPTTVNSNCVMNVDPLLSVSQ